jgi:23S rRNA-/tRNA-specific pseudouridylate synthase
VEEPPSGELSALFLVSGARLILEKNGLLALAKPEGVRSHPNEAGKVDPGAILAAPFDAEGEFYKLGDGRRLHLLHRLDAPTSGVLLFARDETLAKAVRALFAAHAVRKRYLALVFGEGPRFPQVWRDRLKTVRGKGGARTIVGSGDLAEVSVRTLATGKAENGMLLSLLALEPATGRTHQLRVQCASRRLPIAGDATYGDFALNKRFAKELGVKRLCLHSERIALELEEGGRKTSFSAECPAPEFFRSAIRA